jgi:hypothetical protein
MVSAPDTSNYVARCCSLLAALTAVLAVAGCGGEDVGGSSSGLINVAPDPITFERTAIGQTTTETVTIRNDGTSGLEIYSVELDAADGASLSDISLEDAPSGTSIASGEAREFDVVYEPTEGSDRQAGDLVIENSTASETTTRVEISTLGNSPNLRVSPPSLSFPQLPAGQSASRDFTISNDGFAPVRVFGKPTIQGSQDFTVNLPNVSDGEFPIKLHPSGRSEEGQRTTISGSVAYAATDGGSSSATMLIESDEQRGSTREEPTTTEVPIDASADTACIRTDRTTRNLGAAPVGGEITEVISVQNCGTRPLEISTVRWSANSADQEFSYDLGGADANDDGTIDDVVRLPDEGDEFRIPVSYGPTEIGQDEATLAIESNDPFQPTLEIDLIARGADGECPTAELIPKIEGETTAPRSSITATPLDYIILDGTNSEDPDGNVREYEWRNIQSPEGTTIQREDVETASPPSAKQRFRLLTAGTYKIGLRVRDNDGFVSCNEAVATIQAVPDEKISIELTWTNPEDPDESDETGSDVDLHLVKMGPGAWFESPYDIYFDNPNNNSDPTGGGGGIWNPESPSLDRDDTDGAGPENIQMDNPQDCQWYAIGVHYYDQSFGTAYATIRVYINEELAFVQKYKPLTLGGQFWDVARIHWDSGRVYSADTLSPSPPKGEEPAVTTSMENSGLCTSQNLYPVGGSN